MLGNLCYPVEVFCFPGCLVDIQHGAGQAQVLVVRDTHSVAPVGRAFSVNIVAGPAGFAPFVLVNADGVLSSLKVYVCLAVVGG